MTKLQAELYALTHRGNPGDRAFYAKVCGCAQRVLELGAGYGRLLPDLLESGTRVNQKKVVVGLEPEPWLLASARRVAAQLSPGGKGLVKLLRGDMRDFDLKLKFDRITLPYNGLYCLLNPGDILKCFACVKRHLASDGEFVFDVWAADRFHRDMHSKAMSHGHYDNCGPIVSFVHRSQAWDVFQESRLRTRLQRLDVTYTYIPREQGAPVTITIEQRYARSTELKEFVERAGLYVKSIHGDFNGSRLNFNSPYVVLRAGCKPVPRQNPIRGH